MQFHLDKQTVVVVGACGGIGTAIGDAFAGEGAQLALIDCVQTVVPRAEQLSQTHRIAARGFVADVTDAAGLAEVARQVCAELGPCRHAVVAVGVGSGKHGMPFWNLEPADWAPVLNVNIMACVNTSHAFVPQMLPAGDGSLCFLSSVAGQIGSPTDPPYSAAKAAVLNFTQCAARDLAAHGIRVNAICPGMVRTALNESVWRAWSDTVSPDARMDYAAWAAAKIGRVTPLGRWQEPAEVAALAVFLASPWARNITGQAINVDGGQVMHF
jgi:2-hydroxycyclohexanecarboxyl-CoA dehydrogenase